MFSFDPKKNTSSEKVSDQFIDGVHLELTSLIQLRQIALQLAARAPRTAVKTHAGAELSRALGRGLDFAEVREYKAGDDIRMIDWKVTARSGTAHTKLFHEDHEKPTYFFVDYRQCMHFGTQKALKSVLAANMAALLAWSAQRAGNRVGGVVFDGQKPLETKPAGGQKGVLQFLHSLVNGHRATDQNAASMSLSRVLQRLSHLVHTGSTVVFLSDFLGFDHETQTCLNRLRQHNRCIAVHIYDLLESRLPPPGRYAMGQGQQMTILNSADSKQRAKHHQRFQQHQNKMRKYFSGSGNYFVELCTEDDWLEIARQLMRHVG